MKPLTDTMRAKLDAALTHVLAETKKDTDAKTIIESLIADHGARWGYASGTYHLRCAGAAASNTAGSEREVLRAWRRNAIIRLGQIL